MKPEDPDPVRPVASTRVGRRVDPAGIPIHPFLFALSILVFAATETGAHVHSTLRVLAIVAAGTAIIFTLAWLVTRRLPVAAICTTAALLLLSSRDFARLGFALIILAAAVAIVRVLGRSGDRPLERLTKPLNVITGLLLGIGIVGGGTNGTLPTAVGDLVNAAGTPAAEASTSRAGGLPDIFIVLLDGYPRSDVLASLTGSDNSNFIERLKARGFAVADRSRSSYMYTDMTLTALFHGRHLVDLRSLDPARAGANRPALGRAVLNEAPLLESFRELGYVLVANAAAWDEPALRNVDVLIEATGWNEFERHMFGNSLLGSIWRLRGLVVEQEAFEPWIRDAFSALVDATSTSGERPRLAFIHVPAPHFPIVFGAAGTRADPVFGAAHPAYVEAPDELTREAYLGQVQYLNDQLLTVLDAAALNEDAIVVLMSDHGPEFGLNWDDGVHSDLQTRFATFFAARAPDGVFGDDVNVSETLLELLRHLGESDVPVLEDRFFASNATDKHRTMVEVSDPWLHAESRSDESP